MRASCPGALVRPSRSVNSMLVAKPSTGPKGAASFMSAVEKVPLLRTPEPLPFDPALAGQSAVHERDDADRERRQRIGLQAALGEAQLGHVEHGIAGAAAKVVLDGRERDTRAARRMGEHAGRRGCGCRRGRAGNPR